MKQHFLRSVDFVLKWEGGGKVTEDYQDPGGLTKWGIAQRYHPEIDVRRLTKEGAIEIYRKQYWIPAGCDGMVWPWDLIIFDTAVNMGVKTALNLGDLRGDWQIYLIDRLYGYLSRVRVKRSKIKYLRGWVNRVVDLWQEAEKGPGQVLGAAEDQETGFWAGIKRILKYA